MFKQWRKSNSGYWLRCQRPNSPKLEKKSGKLENKKLNKKDLHQLQHSGNQAAKWVKKSLSHFLETALYTFRNIRTHIHKNRRGWILESACSATLPRRVIMANVLTGTTIYRFSYCRLWKIYLGVGFVCGQCNVSDRWIKG